MASNGLRNANKSLLGSVSLFLNERVELDQSFSLHLNTYPISFNYHTLDREINSMVTLTEMVLVLRELIGL